MKTKNILIFTLGVILGVIVDGLFSKLASSRGIKTEDTAVNKFYTNGKWAADYEYIREMNLWNRASAANYHNFEKSLADAQSSDELFDDWIEEHEDSDSPADQEYYFEELITRVFTPEEIAEVRAVSDSLADTQPIRVDEVGKGVEGCQK
jgi:hypothetical protein